jgi:hypothetical protein
MKEAQKRSPRSFTEGQSDTRNVRVLLCKLVLLLRTSRAETDRRLRLTNCPEEPRDGEDGTRAFDEVLLPFLRETERRKVSLVSLLLEGEVVTRRRERRRS